MDALKIDICICTFRRPIVVDTLESLKTLDISPGWTVRVIVADNDDVPSARQIVEKAAKNLPFPLTYLHVPARNISLARNACLNAGEGRFLAFVDDDETVTPGWLKEMVLIMRTRGSDAVIGPVRAVYGNDCPAWIRRGNYHSTLPFIAASGEMTGCSTGNVLLNRESPIIAGLRFREEFGRSGGEDTLFFFTLYMAGGRIDFAHEAWVNEIVPSKRATFAWLVKRRFRSGQTHGVTRLEANKDGGLGHLRNIALAAKVCYCIAAAVLNLPCRERMMFWILRGSLHAGVLSRLLGKHEIEQYGQKEAV